MSILVVFFQLPYRHLFKRVLYFIIYIAACSTITHIFISIFARDHFQLFFLIVSLILIFNVKIVSRDYLRTYS